MRQKNCRCLLWKIITSKNYFPCHFRIWVDSDLSLSLIQVDSGLTLLLVKVDFYPYPYFWLFPRSYPVQGLTGGRSPEGDP